ncbi:alpha-(1,3)-fucosyltransferase 7-like [Amphibalanus amphitrite]|uniref:alpha-(1,3)-fucosyltransferase 7-like n=1 Tax=Amphibalanus amphitrite TaxID=1232801 RepID=UPI001C90AD21|nr:alpha-(1,3)-fucosyltransferase 7-like [Amphibalanus amphitrite]XP_043218694.1 alpha-(1,3)-fucosyltransferase 7-like [Amphibalanus amphitrite]XP_043218701.1 alpha-(1,3)-fucosyltransferase 7-like [Amphibalanus amphitrite]XP_043218711.1 alpha-(1,3)-fucosyltransferase 7-like [Amphibalanus amphitrite]XP_043218720.1 alpha-(1,3)-fucosyltransferase 7-like [Amphibalanus amphitrite]
MACQVLKITRKKSYILLGVFVLLSVAYTFWSAKHHQALVYYVRNRFINQALYRAPELNAAELNNTHLLLYWTPFFQNVAFDGFGRRPFAKCPVNNCVATNDRRYLRLADAVLFHGADMSVLDLPAERSPRQLYAYYVHESPPQLDMLLGPLNSAFNITLTYRRDSDVHMPYFRLVACNESQSLAVTQDRQSELTPPPGVVPPGGPLVAWVVSHCSTDGRREDYVAQLRRYIAVDEFGACSGRPCPRPGALQCYQHLARSHLFYLAFENSLCRDYVTEKFFNALHVGLVPVARGATRAEYEALAPPDSFLHVDDFAGPQELADHLRWLASNGTALARYHRWRSQYRFAPRERWCRLCELMSRHMEPGTAVLPDLHSWWYEGAQCHS